MRRTRRSFHSRVDRYHQEIQDDFGCHDTNHGEERR